MPLLAPFLSAFKEVLACFTFLPCSNFLGTSWANPSLPTCTSSWQLNKEWNQCCNSSKKVLCNDTEAATQAYGACSILGLKHHTCSREVAIKGIFDGTAIQFEAWSMMSSRGFIPVIYCCKVQPSALLNVSLLKGVCAIGSSNWLFGKYGWYFVRVPSFLHSWAC